MIRTKAGLKPITKPKTKPKAKLPPSIGGGGGS